MVQFSINISWKRLNAFYLLDLKNRFFTIFTEMVKLQICSKQRRLSNLDLSLTSTRNYNNNKWRFCSLTSLPNVLAPRPRGIPQPNKSQNWSSSSGGGGAGMVWSCVQDGLHALQRCPWPPRLMIMMMIFHHPASGFVRAAEISSCPDQEAMMRQQTW